MIAPTGVTLEVWRLQPGPTPHCDVLERVQVRLPCQAVLTHSLGSLSLDDLPRPRRRRRPRARLCAAERGFCVDTPEGPVDGHALLVRNAQELVYALRALHDLRDPELERLALLAREPDAARKLSAELDPERDLGPRRRGVEPRVFRADAFRERYPSSYTPDHGATLVSRALGDQALAGTSWIEHRGARLPRRVWVTPTNAWGLVVCDGAHVRSGLSPEQLPEEVRAALDADGEVVHSATESAFPNASLSPRCVVRIPSRAEVAELGPVSRRRLRHKPLRHPALARSLDAPLPLRGTEPVYEDPMLGARVAGQRIEDVFVPGATPRRLTPDDFDDAPRWEVLCDLAGL